MGYQKQTDWYLTKPEAISRYLCSVIKQWGYYVWWNRSDDSESLYLKINLGTIDNPKILHIRISEHSVPPKTQWIEFDTDLYCSFAREGATSYIKLLTKLSEELGKPLPDYLKKVTIGTLSYKNYRITMQRRANSVKGNRFYFGGDRIYV